MSETTMIRNGILCRLNETGRDARLTKFTLYPFDLERALAGDEVITRNGINAKLITKSNDVNVFSLMRNTSEETNNFNFTVNSNGRYFESIEISCYDLFMKHAPKPVVKKSLTNETLEPWLQILALYKRKMPHAEWQAKWESGLELEYLDPANDSEWLDVDANPNAFYENVQFREKPTLKKFQSWRYDYIGVRNGFVYCELFSTQDECEKAVQSHDESVHGKIVKGCYLVEYEL